MNFLDKVIASVSPERGLRRAQARNAIDVVERKYEGAGHGRRMKGWRASAGSANVSIGSGLATLRNRSSDLIRNFDFAANTKEVWISYVVGGGIRARAHKEDLKRFKDWAVDCTVDGQLDFFGVQNLMTGGAFERGDCLIRFVPQRLSNKFSFPFKLQLLEGDHLDHTKNEKLNNGGKIIQGVEFDRRNVKTHYWIFPEHPGETAFSGMRSLKSIRVSAREIIHIFEQKRIGQVRGVPALAPVLSRIKDMSDYEYAEQMRKKVEACFVGFVTQEGDFAKNPLTTGKKDANGVLEQTFEPGLLKALPPGMDIKFGEPTARGGTEYMAYLKTQKEGMSAGVSLPYSAITNDLSQANYSSMRGGELPVRRRVRRYQKQVPINLLCRPVWSAAAYYSELAGRPLIDPRASWVPDKFEPVDPLKDVMADICREEAVSVTWLRKLQSMAGIPTNIWLRLML